MIRKRNLLRNKKGFTLAEIMMAVAIMVILAGVSFVGVVNYLRSMTRLERDGIAKEIYVSAQNHLTMAEEQGFLGVTKKGTSFTEADGSKTYYYVINSGSHGSLFDDDSMLRLLLPFGAVDETVRSGNYIIQYQTDPALVLRVYYSSTSGSARYPYAFKETDIEDSGFRAQTDTPKLREKVTGCDNSVIGYYGMDGASSLEKNELQPPTIKVINAERLTVEITDPNKEEYESLQLIVKGVTSGKEKVIQVRLESGASGELTEQFGMKSDTTNSAYNKYTLVLDDVTTSGLLFNDQFSDAGLIPGEDIEIQAVAYSNTSLANIAKSAVQTTNSLFAETSVTGDGEEPNTASIENIRHLENLDNAISKLGNDPSAASDAIQITFCEQTSDLSWPEFKETIRASKEPPAGADQVSIYTAGTLISGGTGGYFYPVSPKSAVDYRGNGFRVTGIDVSFSGDAGLFGTLLDGSKVENLELVDFTIASNGNNAGALAGSAVNTTVSNVIVYNSSEYTEKKNIATTSGSAGGLIGTMKGGSVASSAAALYVETSSGSAGGLIGTVMDYSDSNKGTITGCYSGGHTENGQYYTTVESTDDSGSATSTKTALYNVKGTGNVGGLVGTAGGAAIETSYSTCSVSGGSAGGLIGTGSGSVANSYATGLVKGSTAEGAFAGGFKGTASNCRYFEIINEREVLDTDNHVTGYDYLKAVGGTFGSTGITAFDADSTDASGNTVSAIENYNNFVTKAELTDDLKSDADAVPYDSTLTTYYQDKYLLRTVAQLGASVTVPDSMKEYIDEYFVETHHGDWPAPETFVINTK